MSEHFLITGAMGCIGAWTVKQLLDEGAAVTTFDLVDNPYRLRLVMDDTDIDKVNFVQGDITDFEQFERVVVDNGITHIIHLAALQVPFCRADPVLGLRVNVVGTTVILETAKRHAAQIQGVVYCSSVAVYGTADKYPAGPLAHDAALLPNTIYGVSKVANEDTARIYWQDHQVRSIGFRPYTVYGPGRDQGISSTPTKAVLAAIVGRPYEITLSGVWTYQYAPDVANCLILAARTELAGAPVFNMGGAVADMPEFVAAIEDVLPEAAGTITIADAPIPLPGEFDDSELNRAIPGVHWRTLPEGVADSVAHFRHLIDAGRIDIERAMA